MMEFTEDLDGGWILSGKDLHTAMMFSHSPEEICDELLRINKLSHPMPDYITQLRAPSSTTNFDKSMEMFK